MNAREVERLLRAFVNIQAKSSTMQTGFMGITEVFI